MTGLSSGTLATAVVLLVAIPVTAIGAYREYEARCKELSERYDEECFFVSVMTIHEEGRDAPFVSHLIKTSGHFDDVESALQSSLSSHAIAVLSWESKGEDAEISLRGSLPDFFSWFERAQHDHPTLRCELRRISSGAKGTDIVARLYAAVEDIDDASAGRR